MPDSHIDATGKVDAASEIAARAHAGMTDKAGTPYIEHPRRVAAKLDDDEAKAVALLHDVLEDTNVSEAALRAEFSGTIVDAVVALTRVSGESPDAYYTRVSGNPLALRVKLADIHDNLEPSRLEALDVGTRKRLMRKYGEALIKLAT